MQKGLLHNSVMSQVAFRHKVLSVKEFTGKYSLSKRKVFNGLYSIVLKYQRRIHHYNADDSNAGSDVHLEMLMHCLHTSYC